MSKNLVINVFMLEKHYVCLNMLQNSRGVDNVNIQSRSSPRSTQSSDVGICWHMRRGTHSLRVLKLNNNIFIYFINWMMIHRWLCIFMRLIIFVQLKLMQFLINMKMRLSNRIYVKSLDLNSTKRIYKG